MQMINTKTAETIARLEKQLLKIVQDFKENLFERAIFWTKTYRWQRAPNIFLIYFIQTNPY